MSDLLHIEVSPLGDHSISRSISKEFLAVFNEKNPGAVIVTRDLAEDSIPHLDGETINAGYTPEDNRSASMQTKHAFRTTLVEEVNNAKHILISTPMWNFAVPSVLKAWIDQIMMPGKTKVDGKVTVIVSQGGSYAEGAPRAGWDWQTGYLKQVFTSIGATDVEVILSEFGLAGVVPAMADFVEQKSASIAAAKSAAKERAAA
ncbi:MAG: NAD(P)H-dependent oxidoreductase [Actinomycetes bacterium]|jgi:FMN-dependent NADH-azoreductase